MAGNSLQQNSMEYALLRFSKELRLRKIEHFVFFGTLLGLTRDGKPIANDDDVDFYVNKNNYACVREILETFGLKINYSEWPNQTNHFIQASGVLENIEIRVDFYFFDCDSDEGFLLEKWNFSAQPENQKLLLKIPKPLIYPIISKTFLGKNICVPKHSEIICEFLYGVDWKIPKTKGVDYKVAMIGGRPLRIFGNSIIKSITRYFLKKFVN
tara:strand:+ start:1036 stop:1671 length:636 start_codon:yes stop_codon:yes gene_type:complete